MNYIILLFFCTMMLLIFIITYNRKSQLLVSGLNRNNNEHFMDPSHANIISNHGIIKDKRTDINKIYDQFYCNVYKVMITDYKILLTQFEIADLQIKNPFSVQNTYVLDLGCGPGHHSIELLKNGINNVAVDQSHNMLQLLLTNTKVLQKQKEAFGKVKMIQGDFNNSNLFKEITMNFSHITMYYFSFYFSNNKQQLIQNIYTWLRKDGFFIVHLVRPGKFDPIVDAANPLFGFSPKNDEQKNKKKAKNDNFVKKQISRVTFDEFDYQSIFVYNKQQQVAHYNEKFQFFEKENGHTKIRYHTQKVEMPGFATCIKLITDKSLFRFVTLTDLTPRGYAHQYICYFQCIKK